MRTPIDSSATLPAHSSARGQYAAVLSARVGSAALQSVTLVFVARHAGPSEFGQLATALAAIGLLISKSDLGLQTQALRLHAKPNHRVASSVVLRLQRLVTVAALTGTTAIVAAILYATDLPVWLAAVPLALWLPKERAALLGVALAEGKSRVHMLSELGSRLISFLVTFLLLLLTQRPAPEAYVIGVIIGMASSTIFTWPYLSRYRGPKIKRSEAIEHIRTSFPYWIAGLSAQVRSADAAIVSVFAGPYQAGIYGLPSRAIGPMRLAGTSMSNVALPYASRKDMHEIKRLDRLVIFMTSSMIVGIIAVWYWIDAILVWAVGPEYSDAALPFQIIVVGVVLNIPGSYLSGTLQGFGKSVSIAKLGTILAFVSVLGASIGATYYGAVGAAATVVLVNLLQLFVVMILSHKTRRSLS